MLNLNKNKQNPTNMLTSGSVMGNLLGYSTGSFLYGLGGFTLPFTVNSAGILILLPLIIKYLPTNKETEDHIKENLFDGEDINWKVEQEEE